MSKVKLQLKCIGVNLKLSEETYCYSAKLYVGGKYIADVGNRGHGGPDHFHPVQKVITEEALNARIATDYPDWEMNGITGKQTIEYICGDIVSDHLTRKDLKRATGKNILFIQDGTIQQVGLKGQRKKLTREQRSRLIDHVIEEYGHVQIINVLPIEQQLTLYKKFA